MPGRTRVRKPSAAQEGEWRMRVLNVLADSDEALNASEIIQRDIGLAGLTPQKLSRIANYLVEMGFVKKGKSKSTGRILYKAVSKMEEQGYEIAEVPVKRPYNGVEWDIEDSLNALKTEEAADEEDV